VSREVARLAESVVDSEAAPPDVDIGRLNLKLTCGVLGIFTHITHFQALEVLISSASGTTNRTHPEGSLY